MYLELGDRTHSSSRLPALCVHVLLDPQEAAPFKILKTTLILASSLSNRCSQQKILNLWMKLNLLHTSCQEIVDQ